MKLSRTLVLGICLLYLGTPSAQAEKEVGNGGEAMVCRNAKGKIISAQLFDLFEGTRSLVGDDTELLTIAKSNAAVDDQVEASIVRLAAVAQNERDESLSLQYRYLWNHYRDRFKLVPDLATRLPAVKDSSPRVSSKQKNCALEPLAYFDNVEDIILVDSEIHGKLSRTHRAALRSHEVLGKVARRNRSAKTSDEVRKLVAYLYASQLHAKKLAENTSNALSIAVGKGASIAPVYVRMNDSRPIQVECTLRTDAQIVGGCDAWIVMDHQPREFISGSLIENDPVSFNLPSANELMYQHVQVEISYSAMGSCKDKVFSGVAEIKLTDGEGTLVARSYIPFKEKCSSHFASAYTISGEYRFRELP